MRSIQRLRNATWGRWPLGVKQLAILLPLVLVAGLPTILWLREAARREDRDREVILQQLRLIPEIILSQAIDELVDPTEDGTYETLRRKLDELSFDTAEFQDSMAADTEASTVRVYVAVLGADSIPRRPTSAGPPEPTELDDLLASLSVPVLDSDSSDDRPHRFRLTTARGPVDVVAAGHDGLAGTDTWEQHVRTMIDKELRRHADFVLPDESRNDAAQPGGPSPQPVASAPFITAVSEGHVVEPLGDHIWSARLLRSPAPEVGNESPLAGTILMITAIDPGQPVRFNFVYASLVVTGVFLVGVLVILLQRVVVSPIRTLSRTMERIAREADYDTPVALDRDDEVGRLQRGLSTMLATIREQIDRINTLNRELQEEKELLEQRVAHRTEALERSNQELDSFAYSVSHDLQEPLRNITHIVEELELDWYRKHQPQIESQLTSILQELEAYDRRLEQIGFTPESSMRPSNEERKQLHEDVRAILTTWNGSISANLQEHLDAISKQCEREQQMVQRILQISRVGRGIRPIPVELNAAVASAREVLAPRLEESGLEIRCPPVLPTVKGDPTLIHQVFMNLISNASRYNDKEDKWVEISATVAPDPDFFEIRIRDNGIGIREKDRGKVFKIFQQLHSTRKFGKGIGAGLTIVQKIIHHHGGTIRFESEYGVGTTFVFTLPRYQENADASDEPPSDPDR